MKTTIVLIFFLAIIAVISVLPASAVPMPKALVCHITHIGEVDEGFVFPDGTVAAGGVVYHRGHVIEISGNAIPAHCSHKESDHMPAPGLDIGDFCMRGEDQVGNIAVWGLCGGGPDPQIP